MNKDADQPVQKPATPQPAIAPGVSPRRRSRKPNLGPVDPGRGWIVPKGVSTPLPRSTNKSGK